MIVYFINQITYHKHSPAYNLRTILHVSIMRVKDSGTREEYLLTLYHMLLYEIADIDHMVINQGKLMLKIADIDHVVFNQG